eukprot:gene755-1059_t
MWLVSSLAVYADVGSSNPQLHNAAINATQSKGVHGIHATGDPQTNSVSLFVRTHPSPASQLKLKVVLTYLDNITGTGGRTTIPLILMFQQAQQSAGALDVLKTKQTVVKLRPRAQATTVNLASSHFSNGLPRGYTISVRKMSQGSLGSIKLASNSTTTVTYTLTATSAQLRLLNRSSLWDQIHYSLELKPRSLVGPASTGSSSNTVNISQSAGAAGIPIYVNGVMTIDMPLGDDP